MLYFAWQPLGKLPRFPALAECMSDVEPDTRQMVRAQNKKKKKSGGFQSMGKTQRQPLVTQINLVHRLCSLTSPEIKKLAKSTSFFSLYSSILSVFSMIPGLSFPVYKGVMKKGYKVPTPIQRKVNYCYSGSLLSAVLQHTDIQPTVLSAFSFRPSL